MASNNNPYQNGSTTILQHEVQQYGDLITANLAGDEAAAMAAIERRTLIQQEQWTCKTNHFPQCENSSLGSEPVRNLIDGSPLLDSQGRIVTVEKHLATKPLRSDLSSRPGPGNRSLTYMSGEAVSRTLNETFGFDGWCLEVKSTNREECIQGSNGKWNVAYTATVRLIIRKCGAFKEDVGAGSASDKDMGQAIGNALKASVTDAMKRAARHFGEKLGNILYQGKFNIEKAPATFEQALSRLEKETEQKYGKKRTLPPSESGQLTNCSYSIINQTGAIAAIPELKNEESALQAFNSSNADNKKNSALHNISIGVKTNVAQQPPSVSAPSKMVNPYQNAAGKKELKTATHVQQQPLNNIISGACEGSKSFASYGANRFIKPEELRCGVSTTTNNLVGSAVSSSNTLSGCSSVASNPHLQSSRISIPTANSIQQGLQTSASTDSTERQQQPNDNKLASATIVSGTDYPQNQQTKSVTARYHQHQYQNTAAHRSANHTTDNGFACFAGVSDPPLPGETSSFPPQLPSSYKAAAMTDITNHLLNDNKGDTSRSLSDQQEGPLEQPRRKTISNPYAARSRGSL